jgi:hypothetical protein
MRECIICQVRRDNGRGDSITYDYCSNCLKSDLDTLRKLHLTMNTKKGPPLPVKKLETLDE